MTRGAWGVAILLLCLGVAIGLLIQSQQHIACERELASRGDRQNSLETALGRTRSCEEKRRKAAWAGERRTEQAQVQARRRADRCVETVQAERVNVLSEMSEAVLMLLCAAYDLNEDVQILCIDRVGIAERMVKEGDW